jgi:large subunit ribosomal protein L28
MWKPNIKNVKIMVNGAAKKMPVCTSCLRSGKVERAIAQPKFEAENTEA